MPDDVRVTCANKSSARDADHRVLYIGGATDSGRRWMLSEESAITGIEAGRWNFFVREAGRTARIVIANRAGRKYLRTESDKAEGNNLLNLPDCP